MSTSIQRRLAALEEPGSHPCLSCALSLLNRAEEPPAGPLPCTHWPRRTLAEDLLELNTMKELTP